MTTDETQEGKRLAEANARKANWKRWGPYLSERAWGTVREDYSADGTAWEYLPHDQARSKAYRWNEDGIAGISDRHQRTCFAIAMWNGKDNILKERLFGLTGNEGNHGEDVKECYYYLDSTPTHSYMKQLYKYPQSAYPYDRLVAENHKRDKTLPEFELLDTGCFNESRYFDVLTEYAKNSPEDILIRVTVANRGPDPHEFHLLPTVWFRNRWALGYKIQKPSMRAVNKQGTVIEIQEARYGRRWMIFEGTPQVLFTENDTNSGRLYGKTSDIRCKDAINDTVVNKRVGALNPGQSGTKVSAHYTVTIPAGGEVTFRMRLTDVSPDRAQLNPTDFAAIFAARIAEADEFYGTIAPQELSDDGKAVMRQALGGMLLSKQYYHYVVRDWLDGDPGGPKPPEIRKQGRNHDWTHLFNTDVISMPDKWEYPWYAAWDLAFHCIPLAMVDSEFAKDQLILLLREWYMHPNGQLPAYEWAFGDVNPPVHAWAAWRVYKIDKKLHGKGDTIFLERVFHKLLLNFTWWVNRKDEDGRNVFQGGFLGLDNIGVFDRSAPLPQGDRIEQADGTGWMAMYSLNLLAIATELARDDKAYEDVASKFWEHFLRIATAMNSMGADGEGMWSEQDGFFYDMLHLTGNAAVPMRIRSMVGLIPLFAVETLESEMIDQLPEFKNRMDWFIQHRPDMTKNVASMQDRGMKERLLLSLAGPDQLRRVLHVMLDENEFLSPYGIRSLSRAHKEEPYTLHLGDQDYTVGYEPAESTTGLFGGNSNWRGPMWFPVNYLLIESLQKFHYYLGDDFKVECPTGSGNLLTLWEVAADLSQRMTRLFLKREDGSRPANGGNTLYRDDPHWRDLILFYEYFHGDDGAGLGAAHQTGWTGLVAKLLQQSGE